MAWAPTRVEGSAEEARRGGTVSATIQPEPVILTSALNSAAPTGVVSGNIFDGLVDYDQNLNPVPALAENWDVAPNGLAITSICARA